MQTGPANLTKVESRGRLAPRREPYWHRLEAGCYVGFRKIGQDSPGTWVARYRDPLTGKQHQVALGMFEGEAPSKRFDCAKRAAEGWFAGLAKRDVSTGAVTLRIACEGYVKHLRASRGDAPADDADGRFRRWIYGDALADVPLSRVTRPALEDWRHRLSTKAVKVNRDAREVPVHRPRSAASVNRDMSSVRAALNRAHDLGQVGTDLAWRVALRPTKNAGKRRDIYLTREERRRLLACAGDEVRPFLQGLAVLPMRPGALASLRVASFNEALKTLTVGEDKAGADRRFVLPAATAKLLSELKGKRDAEAPLFSRGDGTAWNKDAWKKPIKKAAVAAGLRIGTTAYTLRHSTITDLVVGGLDLLSVAKLSGTSVAMIERHYGHLRTELATAALADLEL